MKAFRFRLTRVRRAREIAERLARASWLEAEREATGAEESCNELRRSVAGARAEIARIQQRDELSPGAVLASDRTVTRMLEALADRKRRADGLRRTAEERRGSWSEAERDRRALERLEERQRELHRVEVVRAEDAELEEWAASRRRNPAR